MNDYFSYYYFKKQKHDFTLYSYMTIFFVRNLRKCTECFQGANNKTNIIITQKKKCIYINTYYCYWCFYSNKLNCINNRSCKLEAKCTWCLWSSLVCCCIKILSAHKYVILLLKVLQALRPSLFSFLLGRQAIQCFDA
jgi:hypothetical protein